MFVLCVGVLNFLACFEDLKIPILNSLFHENFLALCQFMLWTSSQQSSIQKLEWFSVIYAQKVFEIKKVYPHSTFISLRAKKDFSLLLFWEKNPPQAKILYVKCHLRVNYKLLIIRLYINGSMVIVLTIIWYLWFQLCFAQCNISLGVSDVINQIQWCNAEQNKEKTSHLSFHRHGKGFYQSFSRSSSFLVPAGQHVLVYGNYSSNFYFCPSAEFKVVLELHREAIHD